MADRYAGGFSLRFPGSDQHPKHDELVKTISEMFDESEVVDIVDGDGEVEYYFTVQGMNPPLEASDSPKEFATRFGSCEVENVHAFMSTDFSDFVIGKK